MCDRLILLADPDRTAAEELKQALGDGWATTCVDTAAAALEQLQRQTYVATIVSLHLKDLPPELLLNRIGEYYPKVLRFVVAREQDRERLINEALGAHQFLVRPFGATGLRSALQATLEAEHWVPSDPLRELIGQMRSLPTVPALYLEIINTLNDASSTTEEVGELIGKDLAIASKLLQVINSPYFGLPRAVTSPSEAVGLLGFTTTQALVVAVELLSDYERLESRKCSIGQLWSHGATVARDAKTLAVLETGEGPLADEAFAAGLLHDIGKAVLAGNFPDRYALAESLARTNQRPLFQSEREVFGVHHGEVGAYLLSLWALPNAVVRAAAWHHEPIGSGDKQFSTLTAVHVANTLSYVSKGCSPGFAVPALDRNYLNEIGNKECLPGWCEQVLGIESAARYLKPESTEAVLTTSVDCSSESTVGPSADDSVKNVLEGEPVGADRPMARNPRESDGVRTSALCKQAVAQPGMLGVPVNKRWVSVLALAICVLGVVLTFITQFTDNMSEPKTVQAREHGPMSRPERPIVIQPDKLQKDGNSLEAGPALSSPTTVGLSGTTNPAMPQSSRGR